jgi:hypothetical protein
MRLSRAGIAQIWLDHTGWNTDRQYGTSTKAWKFDAVGVMKPLPETERVEREVGFILAFEAPGKCRRRTPENWRDFQTRTIRLAAGEWRAEAADKASKPLTKEGEGWYRDLVNMFAVDGLAKKRVVILQGGQTREVLTLTRDEVRDGYRHCGRIGANGGNEALTGAERQKLLKRLNELRDARKIGMTQKLVWLT